MCYDIDAPSREKMQAVPFPWAPDSSIKIDAFIHQAPSRSFGSSLRAELSSRLSSLTDEESSFTAS
jgi:hypothetical protein